MENLTNLDVNSEDVMNNLIHSASKIWESMPAELSEMDSNGDDRVDDAWSQAYNSWQKFAVKVNKKEVFENIAKGSKDSSDNLHKFFKFGLEGYSFFEKKWTDSVKNIENIFNRYKNESSGKYDVFKIYNNIYQKEFSRFFSIPPLGLSREYQAKMQQLLNKSNIFSSALTEFIYFLYIPFEQSFKVVQDTLAEMAEKGTLPENKQDYYEMWIAQLEKHYMYLFKSSEYLEALGNVVGAMSDFKAAQQQIVQDCLQMFGVPVERDMDELYKDIYLLKKRIRTLEKENKTKNN